MGINYHWASHKREVEHPNRVAVAAAARHIEASPGDAVEDTGHRTEAECWGMAAEQAAYHCGL